MTLDYLGGPGVTTRVHRGRRQEARVGEETSQEKQSSEGGCEDGGRAVGCGT